MPAFKVDITPKVTGDPLPADDVNALADTTNANAEVLDAAEIAAANASQGVANSVQLGPDGKIAPRYEHAVTLQYYVDGGVDSVGDPIRNLDINAVVAALAQSPNFTAAVQAIIAANTGGTTVNAAPTATGLTIGGTPVAGQTLQANYTYADAEGNPQGASVIQWIRADNTSGANPQTLTTGSTYVLTSGDVGKYLKFTVLPVASAGTLQGALTTSPWSAVVTPATSSGGAGIALTALAETFTGDASNLLRSGNDLLPASTAVAYAKGTLVTKTLKAGTTGRVVMGLPAASSGILYLRADGLAPGENGHAFQVKAAGNGNLLPRVGNNDDWGNQQPFTPGATNFVALRRAPDPANSGVDTIFFELSTDSRATWTSWKKAPAGSGDLFVGVYMDNSLAVNNVYLGGLTAV